MILEGNERAYGAELARHLMNPRDNDHVTVHSVDGFLADDLQGAFAEVEAISQATQCQNYLFSLSLNPPISASPGVEDYLDAIAATERKLGLVGQPRAIVFHEKNGRRHAHCVWSKIDAGQMNAINLAHYKRKLCDVSISLYRKHDWNMPEGFRESAQRDPQNYSRQEAGQAQRQDRDSKALKAMFRQCWASSDSRTGFEAALKEQGFLLARGDRRGFVAVDADGKIWSLSRWCGVKPKALRERLGDAQSLPSVEEVLAEGVMLPRTHKQTVDPVLEQRRVKLTRKQREERVALLKTQEQRRIEGLKTRQSRLPKGLRAAFLRITGRYQTLLREAEAVSQAALQQDRDEQQALIDAHLTARRDLHRSGISKGFNVGAAVDPQQILLSPSDDLPLSAEQLQRNPALILEHVSHKRARFDRTDVLRELAKRIDDPFALRDAADTVMRSSQLVRVKDAAGQTCFTTRDYVEAEENLHTAVRHMAASDGFGVARHNITHALVAQDRAMQYAFGGRLSDEQRDALNRVLDDRQFAAVVGLAGAGKSTLLATAMDAWHRQGITVHGCESRRQKGPRKRSDDLTVAE